MSCRILNYNRVNTLSPNGETQLLNKSFIGLLIYSLIVLMILNNIRKPINKCLYILVRDNVAIYSVSNNLLICNFEV